MVVLFLSSFIKIQIQDPIYIIFLYFEEHYEWILWDTEFVRSFEKLDINLTIWPSIYLTQILKCCTIVHFFYQYYRCNGER